MVSQNMDDKAMFPRKFGGLAHCLGGEFRRSRLLRNNINRMRFYIFIIYFIQNNGFN